MLKLFFLVHFNAVEKAQSIAPQHWNIVDFEIECRFCRQLTVLNGNGRASMWVMTSRWRYFAVSIQPALSNNGDGTVRSKGLNVMQFFFSSFICRRSRHLIDCEHLVK